MRVRSSWARRVEDVAEAWRAHRDGAAQISTNIKLGAPTSSQYLSASEMPHASSSQTGRPCVGVARGVPHRIVVRRAIGTLRRRRYHEFDLWVAAAVGIIKNQCSSAGEKST